MISLDATVVLAPEAVLQVIDDEAVVLHLGKEEVFSLNATGAKVAALAAKEIRVADLVTTIQRDYAAPGDTLQQDVLSLLNDLEHRGLLVAKDVVGGSTSWE